MPSASPGPPRGAGRAPRWVLAVGAAPSRRWQGAVGARPRVSAVPGCAGGALLGQKPARTHRITESQNGRGWKGPLWVTQPNPLPKQGHPERAAQDLVQAGLEYLQRRRLHSLPEQPGPGLHHPQREEVLPQMRCESGLPAACGPSATIGGGVAWHGERQAALPLFRDRCGCW